MRVGVFGGSFDPVHKGHEHLAREMVKRLKLDKLIVIPAFVSPFKLKKPPKASCEHRLKMLEIAFEDSPVIVLPVN